MEKTCPVCGGTYAESNAFCPIDGTTLRADASSTDLVGSIIADRYKVSKLLGEGGMGRVYLARHVRLPQQAAIKVMNPWMVKDSDAVARFNREAANAARIEHDRVARVFDFGETSDGLVYLAMEFVPGRTLRAVQEEDGRLSPARAANIVYQVAEGLDAAHRINIVHRDLKPDNILIVTDEHGVDRCKVVDFGIAKAADASGTQLTRTGMIVGTPEFMSPEQVVGEAVDARSDVYALALVAFQMLTGQLPFKGSTNERAVMSRLIEDPLTLAAVSPDVAWPSGLQAAISAALDREPATRTATALGFAEAVVAATEAWTGAAVLRGRTPLGTSAVTLAPGSVTPAGPTPASTAPSPPGAAAPLATLGVRRNALALGVAGVAVALVAAWAVFLRGPTATAVAPIPPPTDTTRVTAPATPRTDPDVGGAQRVAAELLSKPLVAGDGRAASPPVSAPATAPVSSQPNPSAIPTGALVGAAVPRATAIDARRGVDSVWRVLASDNSGHAEALAAIPHLERLLRDLGSATDSAGAYLALVSAFGQVGLPQRACNPLHRAQRLATTGAQRKLVADFFESTELACVP